MTGDDGEIDGLVRRAAAGEETALAELFDRYRARLRQMVRLRLDRRLQGRVDPSDVLQEAYLDLSKKLPDYAGKSNLPFFLWLRLVTGERLLRVHRQHLGAAMRDAGRELSLHVYAGAAGRLELYEDAGEGYGYRDGEFALTTFGLGYESAGAGQARPGASAPGATDPEAAGAAAARGGVACDQGARGGDRIGHHPG